MRSLAVVAALILGAFWVFSGLKDSEELLWNINRLAARGEVETPEKTEKVEKEEMEMMEEETMKEEDDKMMSETEKMDEEDDKMSYKEDEDMESKALDVDAPRDAGNEAGENVVVNGKPVAAPAALSVSKGLEGSDFTTLDLSAENVEKAYEAYKAIGS